MRVRVVVGRRIACVDSRVVVIVGVEKIVAPPAVKVVSAGAANEPVVSKVTEDHIITVGGHRFISGPVGVGVARSPLVEVIEVQKEPVDLS